jgi:hypothetical protein
MLRPGQNLSLCRSDTTLISNSVRDSLWQVLSLLLSEGWEGTLSLAISIVLSCASAAGGVRPLMNSAGFEAVRRGFSPQTDIHYRKLLWTKEIAEDKLQLSNTMSKHLRSATRLICKLIWAAYLILTSLYCVLAVSSYTYYAFIEAPPYEWLRWFSAHHSLLYGGALVCGAVGYWRRDRKQTLLLSAFALLGVALLFRPIMPPIPRYYPTLPYAVVALALLLLLSARDLRIKWRERSPGPLRSLGYALPVTCAGLLSIVSATGVLLNYSTAVDHALTNPADLFFQATQVIGWSFILHLVIAIIAVTLLNLIAGTCGEIKFGAEIAYGLLLVAAIGWWSFDIAGFLRSSLMLEATVAYSYAVALATTLAVLMFSLLLPALRNTHQSLHERTRNAVAIALLFGVALVVLFLPRHITEMDWNGTIQRVCAVTIWATLGFSLFFLVPRPRTYPLRTLIATLIITCSIYAGLRSTAAYWGGIMGPTKDEIAHKMEVYGRRDLSFGLAYHLIGYKPQQGDCKELCKVLRESTNIPDTHISAPVDLVPDLTPIAGNHPNIFIFVIDSMRPDYLGAYNNKAVFTPNIDALARDSVVFRNVFTQYAGTTLSEPAIWSGAMLLHSHYLQPFPKVNNLEKLVNTEQYNFLVSYDTVLKQLLSPADKLTKLDTDVASWNDLSVCSTVRQLTKSIDSRTDKAHPVFFYSQPMNVHQFGRPKPPSDAHGWPGFVPRISIEVNQVDTCLGTFFSFLKERGLYDNSIIVLTSDHGDATGEFGRSEHSVLIYPEIMHVPLIMHLPRSLQGKFFYDEKEFAALTDITPSLYYLLGYHHILRNPMFGHSLFSATAKEQQTNARHELFLASDAIPLYGILADDGRYLYTVRAFPANKSELFDLAHDPNAQHDILSPDLKSEYDLKILHYLVMIGEFYGYKPAITTFMATKTAMN